LISGSWPERIEVFFWSCLALYALAGLLQWHLETKLNVFSAGLLALSAILMIWPPFSIIYHLIGAASLFVVVIWQTIENRNLAKTTA